VGASASPRPAARCSCSRAGGSRLITVKLWESHGHATAIYGAEPTGYGLERSEWVNVPVREEGVTLELLSDWIEESYRIVAPKRLVAELDARD
jgi:predicted DNA-binding protein (MmcQ/YjbR family)